MRTAGALVAAITQGHAAGWGSRQTVGLILVGLAGLGCVALVWKGARLQGRDPLAPALLGGLNPVWLVLTVGGQPVATPGPSGTTGSGRTQQHEPPDIRAVIIGPVEPTLP